VEETRIRGGVDGCVCARVCVGMGVHMCMCVVVCIVVCILMYLCRAEAPESDEFLFKKEALRMDLKRRGRQKVGRARHPTDLSLNTHTYTAYMCDVIHSMSPSVVRHSDDYCLSFSMAPACLARAQQQYIHHPQSTPTHTRTRTHADPIHSQRLSLSATYLRRLCLFSVCTRTKNSEKWSLKWEVARHGVRPRPYHKTSAHKKLNVFSNQIIRRYTLCPTRVHRTHINTHTHTHTCFKILWHRTEPS